MAEHYTQRATHYFSERQLLEVERLKLKLLERGQRAGKSQIQRAALEAFLGHSVEHQARLVRELGGEG